MLNCLLVPALLRRHFHILSSLPVRLWITVLPHDAALRCRGYSSHQYQIQAMPLEIRISPRAHPGKSGDAASVVYPRQGLVWVRINTLCSLNGQPRVLHPLPLRFRFHDSHDPGDTALSV